MTQEAQETLVQLVMLELLDHLDQMDNLDKMDNKVLPGPKAPLEILEHRGSQVELDRLVLLVPEVI